MARLNVMAATILLAFTVFGFASGGFAAGMQGPPGGAFKPVHELDPLPDVLPGLGKL